MKKPKAPKELKHDVVTISREIIRKAGYNVPDSLTKEKILEAVADKIGSKGVYILYNDGDLEISESGGEDVVAYLFKEKNTIKGWSI